ncbi:peptide/nickel transport system substrate-binding protein [Deinococcus metalli]|uniref:ABC transporter substrate-binding protein n=1 Tax=Deinococcus metalli TaxID=1141878 RepID=A0A7W8KG96_9DEIO|nr:ABC transporter substrate-binding protein [Deinococcus metalli]MBB5376568.1 peptide/nickel transport system substrate-binding protein [Deinococcus metalli]GHF43074.1 ABC transporter substrate-binding protein [Deinococcus metalli]
MRTNTRTAAALTLTLSLAALGSAYAQTTGGTLRAGMQADPVGLDPHVTQATSTRNQLENVYDTLVAFDASGKVVPSLAIRWTTSKDGLTWTFTLRPGVRFHNGRALEASDVVYSIGRIKDPATKSPRSGDFELVKSITAPNKSTVVMTLSKPFSPLLSKLAFSLNVIVPKEAVATLNTKPVGTGPFTFVEYVPQTRMVLKKNPNFWGRDAKGTKLPYLDGITFTYLPDATARVTALRTGTVDWIEYVPSTDITSLKGNAAVNVIGGPAANYRSLFLNVNQKPLNDPRVRRALAYAMNNQEIVDVALLGVGGLPSAGTVLPNGSYYGQPDATYGKPNLDKARALLKEAGYPNGFTLELKVTSTYDFLRTPAEIIQAQLAPLGVKVNITALEWSVYLPDILKKNYMATILGESGQGDPDDYLYTPFASDSGGNLTNFKDATIDGLLDQGRQTSDPAARKAIYAKVQQRLVELSPMVFLYSSTQYEAAVKAVQGYQHFPNTSYVGLRTTWLRR